MSAIPVDILDTLHELEYEFKSVSNVPKKDARLLKLNRFFNFNEEYEKENRIKNLILAGYNVREIEDKAKTSDARISKIAVKYRLPIRQKFNYIAIKKGKPRIFSASYAGFKIIAKCDTSKFDKAKRGLARIGYKLKVPRKPVRWCNVMPGDKYIDGKEIRVKE